MISAVAVLILLFIISGAFDSLIPDKSEYIEKRIKYNWLEEEVIKKSIENKSKRRIVRRNAPRSLTHAVRFSKKKPGRGLLVSR